MNPQESSNTQLTAEEAVNLKSNLMQVFPIPETPFKAEGNEEVGYYITLGRIKISERCESIEDAIELLETKKWHIITNCIAGMIAINEEFNNQKK